MQALFSRIASPEEAPPWSLFNSIMTFILGMLFFTLAGPTLGLLFFPQDIAAALLSGWTLGGLGITAFILSSRAGEQQRAALRLTVTFPALIAFGIGFGTLVTLDLLAILFVGQVTPPPEFALLVAPTPFLWLLAGVFSIIIQPISEELLFRGVLYPTLRQAQSAWLTIIVTALFYGFFHQLIYTYSPELAQVRGVWWYSLAEPIGVGVVLGMLRAATRSTSVAIFAHVGVGTFALLKTILIVSLLSPSVA
jgi:membrane protease YdiL (CAAX protease family)